MKLQLVRRVTLGIPATSAFQTLSVVKFMTIDLPVGADSKVNGGVVDKNYVFANALILEEVVENVSALQLWISSALKDGWSLTGQEEVVEKPKPIQKYEEHSKLT